MQILQSNFYYVFTGDYAGDCAHSEMRYNMNDLNLTDKVINSMIEYNRGDARRIQHAMKVYEFAALMGRMEGISEKEQQVLEIAADRWGTDRTELPAEVLVKIERKEA